MFGLMRSRTCGLSPDEKLRRRLHYCGTCKSIGTRYGQRARLLLNFDSVFAAEVLTAVAGLDAPSGWDANIHSINCFRLPDASAVPEPVRFAAAMTVVLAEVKIADHTDDGRGAIWRALRAAYGRSFRRASADLARNWGFPVDELWALVRAQAGIERRLSSRAGRQEPADLPDLDGTGVGRDPLRILALAARSTAGATALAFRHGARAAGRMDAAPALEELGRAFGSLVYALDAFRDVAEDHERGTFNAFSVAFGCRGAVLDRDVRRRAIRYLRSLQADTETALVSLPIASERAALFVDRLRSNLDRVTATRRLRVLDASLAHPGLHPPVRRRPSIVRGLRDAVTVARAVSTRHFASCKPLPIRVAEAPVVFLLALGAACVAPAAVAAASSPRDIVDALLNVATLGASLGSAVAMAIPPMGPGMDPAAELRRRGRKGQTEAGSADGSTSECCCDCCDCCSDGNTSCGTFACCGDASWCGGCGDCGNCCHCSNSCGDCSCGECCNCNGCDCDCGGCCDCN